MRLEAIAAELRLDVRTVRREFASIAQKFADGGLDLANLNGAEVRFFSSVLLAFLSAQCPVEQNRTSGVEDVARAASAKPALSGSDVGRRARLLPRFRKTNQP